MIKKCIGCGIILQDKNPHKIGYVENFEQNYCQRCFKLKHYNEYSTSLKPILIDDFLKIINKGNKTIIYMVDFFNINKITMEHYHKIKQEKILVITKLDLIPKNIKISKIKKYLIDYYKIKEDIFFTSNIKKTNINLLINYIKTRKNSIYLVGLTNSGKSSFINALLNKNDIVTSIMPNTTLSNIKVLFDNVKIYDTPGINYNNFIYDNFYVNKKINTKKYIKPKTYQTKKDFNLNIENYFNIWTNSTNSFTLYISNELKILKSFKDSKDKEFKINKNSDIVIYGIGFINIKKSCIIKCNLENFEIRPSIFRGDF